MDSFGLTLRQRQASAAGYDGAVFVDREGHISEATIWNVGFFEQGSVVWPRAAILRGITQMIIDDGLARMGMAVKQYRCSEWPGQTKDFIALAP